MAVPHLIEHKLRASKIPRAAPARTPLAPLGAVQRGLAVRAPSCVPAAPAAAILRPQRLSRIPLQPLSVSPYVSPVEAAAAVGAPRKRIAPMHSSSASTTSLELPFGRRPPPLQPISGSFSSASNPGTGCSSGGRHNWSPPVLRPRSDPGQPRSAVGKHWAASSANAIDTRSPATPPRAEDAVHLLFDSVLNCYFDPKTNKYFELRT